MVSEWFVYIVECANGSYYTGATDSIEDRVRAHNAKKGGRYTRSFGPVRLLWAEAQSSYGVALKRESQIKRLTRAEKEAFVKGDPDRGGYRGMRAAFAAGLVLLAASVQGFSAGLPARTVQVRIGNNFLIVGEANPGADRYLDCPESSVQHTIRRCQLKERWVSSASSLGHAIKKVTLNMHFQGTIVNMGIEYAPGVAADLLIHECKTLFAREPKIEYWADEAHLYASYIWIDEDTEVEISKTIRGGSDGEAKLYVSNLSGNRPLHPKDAP
ncbi:MAG: GIY-YIG nuclease family protein [Elusimicrobia bacterium]|nr:GIY-YIG nuclease family protein [Elusimicrobiota bacterium]